MGPAIFFRCLSAFFSSLIDLNFSRGVPTRNTQNPQVGNRHVADPQHWFETGNKHDVVLSPWSFSLANSRNRRCRPKNWSQIKSQTGATLLLWNATNARQSWVMTGPSCCCGCTRTLGLSPTFHFRICFLPILWLFIWVWLHFAPTFFGERKKTLTGQLGNTYWSYSCCCCWFWVEPFRLFYREYYRVVGVREWPFLPIFSRPLARPSHKTTRPAVYFSQQDPCTRVRLTFSVFKKNFLARLWPAIDLQLSRR